MSALWAVARFCLRLVAATFGVATLMALVGASRDLPFWRTAVAGLVLAMIGWIVNEPEEGHRG